MRSTLLGRSTFAPPPLARDPQVQPFEASALGKNPIAGGVEIRLYGVRWTSSRATRSEVRDRASARITAPVPTPV